MPWYKGNLHCHSNRSDGRATPCEVAAFYRTLAHDFLGLADHNRCTPLATWADDSGLLGIPCAEYSGETCCHVLAVGVTGDVAPARKPGAKPRPKPVILQDGVTRTLRVGGIPVLCHPHWNWTWDETTVARLRGCRHFEICNASPDCNAYPVPGYEPGDTLWDRLLTSGRRWFGLANDDAHNYYAPAPPRSMHAGRGYNVVHAPALSRRHVLAAIRDGRFYASTGIEIRDYRVSHSGLRVRIEPRQAERAVIQFFGAGGRILHRTVGHAARYTFRGDEGYVRVRIGSTAGFWAWTQPVFLDDLAPAIRWTHS